MSFRRFPDAKRDTASYFVRQRIQSRAKEEAVQAMTVNALRNLKRCLRLLRRERGLITLSQGISLRYNISRLEMEINTRVDPDDPINGYRR